MPTLPLQHYLGALLERNRGLRDGNVAAYIPELAKADPDWFGICVVTVDGYVYGVGDTDVRFTIQSMSKPAVYAAALADRGRDAVLAKVGVEPSGEAFNSISLAPQSGAPLYPMIFAGAIASTGLVAGSSPDEQWSRIARMVSLLIGRDVDIDEAVYRSESETGFRNRAIGWLLRNFGILEADPMGVLENYFRQCAISVTCTDLAFMAATFANAGVHPVTRRRAMAAEDVQTVLSVMSTCGMYDYAGSWLYEVGLPAKSGVSGGIFAVLPGRFGIGIFSPPLDAHGNSTRGVAVCRQMSRDFGLHVFSGSPSPALVLSRTWSGYDAPSRRVRTAATAERLRALSSRIVCLALQGEVAFDGAEFIVRRLMQHAHEGAVCFVLDMHRVSFITDSAAGLLHDARRLLAGQNEPVVFARIRGRPGVEDALRRSLAAGDSGYLSFEDNDVATEWCENRLLASAGAGGSSTCALDDFGLFAGMSASALGRLSSLLLQFEHAAGATIIAAGARDDDRVFLIREGEVSVVLPLADGSHQRIATLSSGMTFGEMAMINSAPRSAYVHADTTVRGWSFSAGSLDRLAVEYPDIKITVLHNLALDLAHKLREANQLVGALAA